MVSQATVEHAMTSCHFVLATWRMLKRAEVRGPSREALKEERLHLAHALCKVNVGRELCARAMSYTDVAIDELKH